MTKVYKPMKRLNYILLTCIGLLVSMSACSSEDNENGKDSIETDVPRKDLVLSRSQAAVVEGQNNFAVKLLDISIQESNSGKNVICSPLSSQFALSMIANCAGNESLPDILKVLNAETLQDVNAATALLKEELPSLDPYKAKVNIANAAWLNNTKPNSSLLKTALSNSGTSNIFMADFANVSIKNQVNSWVKQNTNDLIPNFMDNEVSSQAKFVLCNCLTFEGVWSENLFKKQNTVKKTFFDYDGHSIGMVPMMQATEKLEFSEVYGTDCFRIDYGNGAYSLYLICEPNNKEIISEWAKLPSFNLVKEFNTNPSKVKTQLSLPTLDFTDEPALEEALLSQNVNLNNLKTISSDGRGESSPVSAIQKVRVIMNETGTTAAAATGTVSYIAFPDFIEANLNKPYVFFIAERSSGVILFAGHIQNPNLKE